VGRDAARCGAAGSPRRRRPAIAPMPRRSSRRCRGGRAGPVPGLGAAPICRAAPGPHRRTRRVRPGQGPTAGSGAWESPPPHGRCRPPAAVRRGRDRPTSTGARPPAAPPWPDHARPRRRPPGPARPGAAPALCSRSDSPRRSPAAAPAVPWPQLPARYGRSGPSSAPPWRTGRVRRRAARRAGAGCRARGDPGSARRPAPRPRRPGPPRTGRPRGTPPRQAPRRRPNPVPWWPRPCARLAGPAGRSAPRPVPSWPRDRVPPADEETAGTNVHRTQERNLSLRPSHLLRGDSGSIGPRCPSSTERSQHQVSTEEVKTGDDVGF